jgi:hypothetical protein
MGNEDYLGSAPTLKGFLWGIMDFPRSSGHAGVILWTSHALVDTPELFFEHRRKSNEQSAIQSRI